MFDKLIDRLTQSLAAARGPIRVPSELAADFAAGIAGAAPVELDRWLELPREHQAPAAAIAMYRCSAAAVTVAIVDPTTRALHAVLEGPAEALARFEAMFRERFCAGDNLIRLANIKTPTDPPPPPPLAPTPGDELLASAVLVASARGLEERSAPSRRAGWAGAGGAAWRERRFMSSMAPA